MCKRTKYITKITPTKANEKSTSAKMHYIKFTVKSIMLWIERNQHWLVVLIERRGVVHLRSNRQSRGSSARDGYKWICIERERVRVQLFFSPVMNI